MRYERANSGDWVEIKGADELSIGECDSLYKSDKKVSFTVVQDVLTASHFVRKGNVFDASIKTFYTPKATDENPNPQPIRTFDNMYALTVKQWDWLRSVILEATRDEALDPEA